jgi:hypothetical protein
MTTAVGIDAGKASLDMAVDGVPKAVRFAGAATALASASAG